MKLYFKLYTLSFTLLSILPDCWDLEEVDRRAFATTLGIDTNPSHQFILTVQIPIPQKMLRRAREPQPPQGKILLYAVSGVRVSQMRFGSCRPRPFAV
jgi:hypothetical protein